MSLPFDHKLVQWLNKHKAERIGPDHVTLVDSMLSKPYNGPYRVTDVDDVTEEGSNKDGVPHGLFKRWVGAEFNMMGEYVDGVREGMWMEPYDERFREFGKYKNGKRDGVWTVRTYDDDKPHPPRPAWERYLEQTEYKDGVLQGAYHKHHLRTGNLICHGGFKDDRRNGAWYYYYPNGKLKKHGCYKNGSKVGVWRRYDKNGKLDALRAKGASNPFGGKTGNAFGQASGL